MTCPRQCCTIPPSLYFHTPLPQDAMIHMRPHFPHKTVSLSLSLFLLLYVCVNMKAAVNLWWVKIKYRQSACFIFLPGHLHHLVRMTSSVFKRIKMNILNSTVNLWLIMLISSTKVHISTAHSHCWYFVMSTCQTDFFTWYQTANLFSEKE